MTFRDVLSATAIGLGISSPFIVEIIKSLVK